MSEIVSNAILHSDSAGEFFTIRVEAHPGYVRIECEDLGGEWHRTPDDDRPHGLEHRRSARQAPGNWGTETTSGGNRVVWVRLDLPPAQATPEDAPAGQDSRTREHP